MGQNKKDLCPDAETALTQKSCYLNLRRAQGRIDAVKYAQKRASYSLLPVIYILLFEMSRFNYIYLFQAQRNIFFIVCKIAFFLLDFRLFSPFLQIHLYKV